MQSFFTSLNALKASQTWLDVVGNNMANQDTPGYAADQQNFSDTLTQAWSGQATGDNVASRMSPSGWWGGTGSVAGAVQKDFSTMPVQTTGVLTDLAIQGPGFFMVQSPNGGQPMLTKAGNFTWSKMANGSFALATQSGHPVLDTNGKPITAPGGNTDGFAVEQNGTVTFNHVPTGQKLALAEVTMPGQSLTPVNNTLFSINQGAKTRIVNGPAGAVGNGNGSGTSTIRQGALSQSNVDLTKVMVDMLSAQRMFDLNAQAEEMSNKMMGIAATLRG